MLRSVDMQDYMLSNPVKIKGDTAIFEAIHQILIYKVSGLCVVDDNNILIGMLSEMDCLRAILGAVYNDSPAVGVARAFLPTDVISASLHDSIVDVATDMLKHKHRRRPVIDRLRR